MRRVHVVPRGAADGNRRGAHQKLRRGGGRRHDRGASQGAGDGGGRARPRRDARRGVLRRRPTTRRGVGPLARRRAALRGAPGAPGDAAPTPPEDVAAEAAVRAARRRRGRRAARRGARPRHAPGAEDVRAEDDVQWSDSGFAPPRGLVRRAADLARPARRRPRQGARARRAVAPLARQRADDARAPCLERALRAVSSCVAFNRWFGARGPNFETLGCITNLSTQVKRLPGRDGRLPRGARRGRRVPGLAGVVRRAPRELAGRRAARRRRARRRGPEARGPAPARGRALQQPPLPRGPAARGQGPRAARRGRARPRPRLRPPPAADRRRVPGPQRPRGLLRRQRALGPAPASQR